MGRNEGESVESRLNRNLGGEFAMSVRLDLLKDTIATASENYKDNVRAFAVLDDKARRDWS